MSPIEKQQKIIRRAKRRRWAEARFRWYGRCAVGLALLTLVYLLYSIITPGISGFTRHEVQITVDAGTTLAVQSNAQKAMIDALQNYFPEIAGDRVKRRQLSSLLSISAASRLSPSPEVVQQVDGKIWLPLSDKADQYLKGNSVAGLNETQIGWLDKLKADGHIQPRFNTNFFTSGDSREPEMAGFFGSMAGSFYSLIVCLSLSLIIGILTAIYLEEFARRSWFTHFIEVNIANLAAVPSIIFGLLGLAVYLHTFGLPRSSALAGGLTLALMTLPVIIISARASLKAVPPSIRDAARGLGASPMQVVAHHVVPYALPGMMTGIILGMARAIGETAPLLMIGMVAFIADVPAGFLDPATAMPVQIYIWASSPEAGFVEKTSTGIIVLLMMLMLMNAAAVFLRRRFEIKW